MLQSLLPFAFLSYDCVCVFFFVFSQRFDGGAFDSVLCFNCFASVGSTPQVSSKFGGSLFSL